MKRIAILFSLLLAAALPCAAQTTTVANPVLVSGAAGQTFTFDMPRILTSVVVCTNKGGGYVTITTDAGETAKRYFITTVPPCSAPVTWTLTFAKLANSVTFSYAYTDPANPTVVQFAVQSITYAQRIPAQITIVNTAPLTIDGLLTNVSTADMTITVTINGVTMTLPAAAAPVCIPVGVLDAQGNTLGTTKLCLANY